MSSFPSVRIDKKDWFELCFGVSQNEFPLLRQPILNFANLSSEMKEKLMQVFVAKGETLQILAIHESFFLAKKRDGVIGWIEQKCLIQDDVLKAFPKLYSKLQSSAEFFKEWLGTPYIWGGVGKSGIDCSGFSQAYFFDVLNIEIPKNSQDQRKLGKSIKIDDINDNDLLFCHRKGNPNINHVGLFYFGKVYHSHLNRGVVCDELDSILDTFTIQDIKRILPKPDSPY